MTSTSSSLATIDLQDNDGCTTDDSTRLVKNATYYVVPVDALGGTAIRVSVIIVGYNSCTYLDDCLAALYETINSYTEVILIDNGSTDGSGQFVSRAYPRVRLYQVSYNGGYAAGCNLGSLLARGKYLLFLNPDTRVTPGWLEPLVSALESNPHVGLATPKILLTSHPDRINACGNDVHISGLTLCRGLGLEWRALSCSSPIAAVSGAAFLIRRDLFAHLGGFDDNFFMYMEDTDLSWRARLAGWRCHYVPESVVYHDYALRLGRQRIFYQERNRYLMLLKSLRWRTLALLTPVWLLAEVITWGYVISSNPSNLAGKLRAYQWVWRHRSEIAAKRRKIQCLRRATDKQLLSVTSHELAYEQAGSRFTSRLAHHLFDSLFYFLRAFSLLLLNW